ncbi:unnamed protein product [Mytilus edulis]|uniref:THAP-type domain-containing protein n=1 Tax=Mytilus edulis TaxID=6550 RepID=A0A8S3PWE7_MYTED|nr:unnamed protein product [Mytilus edulis]
MAATNQQPIVSISDSDIAKIAIAVKQILTDDFKALIEEKQRPILFELAEIKQKQTELEFSYGEDVKNFKNQIDYLKIKCDELEQHSRKQCVRLSGVPYTLGENTNTKIIEIANKLGVDMQPNDIMISHRTGRAKPRQIIARIPNHNLKKKLLKFLSGKASKRSMVNFHCIAEGCSNDSRKKHNAVKYPDMILNGCIVDFHVLPSVIKNPKLRKLWLSQIRREGFNPDPNCHWHALCSRHFIEGRPTKENAVPTLFAYNNYKTGTPRDTKNSTLRPIEQLILTTQPANIVTVSQLPKVPRQKKYIPDIPVISYIEKPSLDHTYCTSTEVSEEVSIEEKCIILIENSNTLEQKCQRYETDNNQLRKQVKLLQVELHATKEENKVLNEKFNNTDELLKDKLVEKLTKSNSNVKCFLGLPSISMLFGIFKLLEGHASKMKYWMGPDSSDGKRWQVNNKKKPGASRKLTFFEEFVITLLRLRLGLNTYVLSLLFGVSQSTISRVFTTWISLMAQCLGPLIKWPSKEKIKKHMPLSFRRKYPNTRVIIDATEFYVQRPRNPTAQSKTWSNYKSKNTFKTLVGITPNGAFSFISDLWTGNISDRSITERSGFIDLIEKGDHVMADRGF